VTDELEETGRAGPDASRWNGREAIAVRENARDPSADQWERAIELFRPAF
jgi:hypothetical protein